MRIRTFCSAVTSHLAFLLALFAFWPVAAADFPGEEWERLSDEEAAGRGWSRERLAEAKDYTEMIDTEAVMVVVGGKILDEWGAVDRKLNVHSIRKSLLSAMCGIQVEAGRLDLSRISRPSSQTLSECRTSTPTTVSM